MTSSHLSSSFPHIFCTTQENRNAPVSVSPLSNPTKFKDTQKPIPTRSSTLKKQRELTTDPIVPQTKPKETDKIRKRVRVDILSGCLLGIDKLSCDYSGEGGVAMGHGIYFKDDKHNSKILDITFNLKTMYIRPVTTDSAKILGWPFPPFFKLEIVPKVLYGKIYQDTGKVELNFKANLLIQVGNSITSRPLPMETVMTSDESKGSLFKSMRGTRFGKDGKCKLVGIAPLGAGNDPYIDLLFGLPSECFANLNVVISFL